jgi:hypothetical protein
VVADVTGSGNTSSSSRVSPVKRPTLPKDGDKRRSSPTGAAVRLMSRPLSGRLILIVMAASPALERAWTTVLRARSPRASWPAVIGISSSVSPGSKRRAAGSVTTSGSAANRSMSIASARGLDKNRLGLADAPGASPSVVGANRMPATTSTWTLSFASTAPSASSAVAEMVSEVIREASGTE